MKERCTTSGNCTRKWHNSLVRDEPDSKDPSCNRSPVGGEPDREVSPATREIGRERICGIEEPAGCVSGENLRRDDAAVHDDVELPLLRLAPPVRDNKCETGVRARCHIK